MISTTMGGAGVTSDPRLAERLRAFQRECPPPGRSLTARRLAKLALYHVLTQPNVHTVTRPAYELLGEYQPLPVPTSDAELAGERPEHYEERLAAGQAEIALSAARSARRQPGAPPPRRGRVREGRSARSGSPRRPWRTTPSPPGCAIPVRVKDREAAIGVLRKRMVPGTWFTSVQEEAVRPTINGYVAGTCPQAETAGRELVNLPTHPRVSPRTSRLSSRSCRRSSPHARSRPAAGLFRARPARPAGGARAARRRPRGRRDRAARRGPSRGSSATAG